MGPEPAHDGKGDGRRGAAQVLGVLCMIDEGEADWKVIAIDREDEWCVCTAPSRCAAPT